MNEKTLAGNGRFCEMAAVTPQKRQCEIGNYYPAASVVEAATSQSRWDVRRQCGNSAVRTEKLV